MRRRRSIRVQERDRRYVGSMMRSAEARRPRCGCPANATEADPALWPCPCGSHCSEHGREAPDAAR